MRGKLSLNLKTVLIGALCIFLMCLLIIKPQIGMLGVKNGLYICAGQVIPALFPFCVISCFLVKSEIINLISNFFAPITKRLFKLSSPCAGAVLLSFTGGFPVGAISANALYENGEITLDEYKRMMLFCVNAGPAFVIGTVGNAILGNVKAGAVLFLSLTLSGVILGILSSFIENKTNDECIIKTRKIQNLSESLIKSVTDSTYTMLNICAWIILFSCILEFVNTLNISDSIKDFILSACEVTRGCSVSKKYKNLHLTAFILGWSGVSVHLQVFKYVKKSKLNPIHFICARIINASLACLISFVILKFVPISEDVFGSITNPYAKAFCVSVPSGICMLIMGVSFILELDRTRRKC